MGKTRGLKEIIIERPVINLKVDCPKKAKIIYINENCIKLGYWNKIIDNSQPCKYCKEVIVVAELIRAIKCSYPNK